MSGTEEWDPSAWAQCEAEKHRPDKVRQCCTCGFGVWSTAHVVIMVAREQERVSRSRRHGVGS